MRFSTTAAAAAAAAAAASLSVGDGALSTLGLWSDLHP